MPSDELAVAVQEAGSLLDAADTKHYYSFAVRRVLEAVHGKSELHRRACLREEYVASVELDLPQRRALDRVPFDHRFFRRPTGLEPEINDELLGGPEAHRHYALRARTTPHAWLAARYADLAFQSGTRETRLEFVRLAVERYVQAFEHRVVSEPFEACAELLRALELAVKVSSDDLVKGVCDILRVWLDANLSSASWSVSSLIYGLAAIDKKLSMMDYGALAQRVEELGHQGVGRRSDGTQFGFAYGLAKLTKDPARIERVGRLHVNGYLDKAKQATGQDRVHRHHWYREAWSVLEELPGCKDLRDEVLKGMQEAGEEAGEFLISATETVPLTPDEQAAYRRIEDGLVEAGLRWPEEACRLLLRYAPLRADCEKDIEGLIAPKLMPVQRIEDGGTHMTSGDDWRHQASRRAITMVFDVLWPQVLGGALPRLDAAGALNANILCQPFIRRGFGRNEGAFIASAAEALARGDFVAAMQLWVLLAERLVGCMLQALGAVKITVKPDREQRAPFEVAMERYQAGLAAKNSEHAERACNMINALLGWKGFSHTNWRNRVAHGLVAAPEADFAPAYTAFLLCVLIVLPLPTERPGSAPTENSV